MVLLVVVSRYFYQNRTKSQWGKLTFYCLLFEVNSYSISLPGAHSKVVLRVHGMDEAGVQFPVGPPKTQNSDCSEFCAFVEGAGIFLFERSERQKCRAGVAKFFRQEKYL